MPKKKILTIGFELASDDVETSSFRSYISLLDWDIIFFRPDIEEFIGWSETFQGKPSLSDDASFRLKGYSEHWRRELREAFDNGKLVVIYLSPLKEVFVDTGSRSYSGTGRNRQTTRHVNNFDNYKCIPASFSVTNKKGSQINLVPDNSAFIASYWKEFESVSSYKVVLEGENVPACLITKSGKKNVGALYRSKKSSGAMLFLPDIDFYPNDFLIENEENDEYDWSEKAVRFSSRLIEEVISIEKSLQSLSEYTPEPSWVKKDNFSLNEERALRVDILEIERKLEEQQKQKEALIDKLEELGQLRHLLYEKGTPLEDSIVKALKIIGFEADRYQDEKSEFDSVFFAEEGRLIGEAEGKDNKAVNITKLRQLALNLHEDLERDEVNEPAKGVLFGNPFRLTELSKREEPFTDKCLSASATSSIALVCCPDLFAVAQYVVNTNDVLFAKRCREAIVTSIGKVIFPDIPKSEKKQLDALSEDN